MIQLSKIDENLSIYKGKTIIIWGTGSAAQKLLTYFNYFHIPIAAFTDNNPQKWNTSLYNIPIICPDKITDLFPNHHVIIQIGSSYEKEIKLQLDKLNLDYVLYSEANVRLYGYLLRSLSKTAFTKSELLDKSQKIMDITLDNIKENLLSYIIGSSADTYNIILAPAKTGNYTINKALENQNQFHYINLWHRPDLLPNSYSKYMSNKKIKILTAVREPIAQNLSLMYESLDDRSYSWIYDEAWNNNCLSTSLFEKISEKICTTPVADCTAYTLDYYGYYNSLAISNFYNCFNKYFLDITKYPFDTDSGYSIIKDNNMEIFVYQLEKLTQIWPVLSNWLNIPSIELVPDNEAKNKWYYNSYLTAKKEITFSKKYFEYCFNLPYVQHCYSQKDISIFKEKWSSHIKN